jgi:hypothetical protein
MSMSQATPLRMNGFFTANPVAVPFNATTVARAHIAICQRTGTIDRVKFLKRTAAGNGAVANCRIETVSGSNPTGTLVAAGAEGSLSLDATTGVKTIALNTPLTVTAGDIIAVILYCSDATGTPSIAGTIATPHSLPSVSAGIPGHRSNAAYSVGSASGWTNGTGSVVISFAGVYTDGTPLAGAIVPSAIAVATTNVPTSGVNSYLGLKFAPDSNCDLEYVQFCARGDGSITFECYDSGNTLLGTTNTLASGVLATASANTIALRFATPIALTGGQSYRLVQRSISGLNNNQTSLQLEDSAMLSAIFGTWCQTSSSDGTTWTDDTTGIAPGVLPFITPTSSGGSTTHNPFRSRAFGGGPRI